MLIRERFRLHAEGVGEVTWGMFPFAQDDTALVVGEAFKVLDGKLMMIQAVMA